MGEGEMEMEMDKRRWKWRWIRGDWRRRDEDGEEMMWDVEIKFD